MPTFPIDYATVPVGTPGSSDWVYYIDNTTGTWKKAHPASFGGGGGGDTTAPTIVSITAINSTTLRYVYSESVTMTLAGHSWKKNGSAWTGSSITGSGTTWDVTMATAGVSSDTLLASYNSTTGATLDTASNELVTFTDTAVTNSIAGLVDITFPTNVTLVNTSGVLTGTTASSGWANIGLSALKLPSGIDGFIQAQFVTGDTGAMLGFNTSNSNDPYAGYEAAFSLDGAGIYNWESGSPSSSLGTPTNGYFYRISRTGSVLKFQSSPTGGPSGTWTDIRTYTFSSTADLFICIAIDKQSVNGILHYPKGYNIV